MTDQTPMTAAELDEMRDLLGVATATSSDMERLLDEVDRERGEHTQTRQAAARAVSDCVRLERERDELRAQLDEQRRFGERLQMSLEQCSGNHDDLLDYDPKEDLDA